MELFEKIRDLWRNKKTTVVTALGAVGLLLIMISSILPDKKQSAEQNSPTSEITTAESYCRETEKRLEDFLEKIDGAGNVEVYLTVGSGERYVYAAEEQKSVSENKVERNEKYVLIGGSQREPLIEKVETPEITGAVVICSGCESPVVEERIYKAVSAALGISTMKIYVSKGE